MNVERLIQQAVEAIQAGSFEIAERVLLEVLSISRNQDNRRMEIKVLHHLVDLYLKQGAVTQAENIANQSLEIAKEISDSTSIYKSLYNLVARLG